MPYFRDSNWLTRVFITGESIIKTNNSTNIRKTRNRFWECPLGPGEVVWWKNRKWEISWHCPFNSPSNWSLLQETIAPEWLANGVYFTLSKDKFYFQSVEEKNWCGNFVNCLFFGVVEFSSFILRFKGCLLYNVRGSYPVLQLGLWSNSFINPMVDLVAGVVIV